MAEIINPHEQLQMAAEAAGYLGELDEDAGERKWQATHCQADEWNPRESMHDAGLLICSLGLLVEVDRTACVVTVVIGAEYQVEHAVMSEPFSDTRGVEDVLMLAVTRAAAEVGRYKVMRATEDAATAA